MISIPRALPPVTHGSALQAPESLWVILFTTDLTNLMDRTDYVLWRIEEIKKFVAFPRLTPLQTDAYAQS